MKSLLHYFRFYHRITHGRFHFILLLALAGAAWHAVAGMALYAVLNFQVPPEQMNFLARSVFRALDLLGVATVSWRLALLLGVATAAALFSAALLIYEEYYVANLRAVVAVRLQSEALTDLLNSGYEHVLTENIGHLTNVIVSQIRVTAQSLSFFSTLITHSFFAALYLVAPFLLDYKVALYMFLVALPLLPLIRLLNRRIRDLSVRSIKALSRVNELLLQTLNHVKYLKATGTYPALVGRFTGANREYARMTRNLVVWSCLGPKGLPPIAIVMISLLIFWKVFYGGENPMNTLLILGILYAAAQKAITIPTSYQKFIGTLGAIVAYEDLAKALATHREPPPGPDAAMPDFTGALAFHEVSFQYAAGKEPVLRGVSLAIPARSSVAFVGGSGAGKSTVVNLVTGLLQPTVGAISLGGKDYREINLPALRAGIGYVTQEAVIFGDTVRHNLSMWRDGVTEADLREAARRAHADAFVAEMPQGYDTVLGDQGFTISGGQRQRLAIAREILRQTPILVLDEATSALDTATEQLIQESIREFHGSKTIILIAHRLSTVRHCDRIFLLDQGRVAESGTYDELFQAGGRFRAMVDRQSLE